MLLNLKEHLYNPRILLFLPSLLERMIIFFNIILLLELMGSPKDFNYGENTIFDYFYFFIERI